MVSLSEAWPADSVTRRSVAELVPFARNPRTHSPEQVDQLCASIREWGWTMPVLLDEAGGIIAGHGRVLAAKKLAIDSVPCMVAKGWSEARKAAYVVADNKLALNADWDDDLLRVVFDDLKASDFDLDLTGFDEAELKDLYADPFEDQYSRKLIPPIYEPKSPPPPISALVDETKAIALKREIEQASLPREVADFLCKAADRHAVFDFHSIADYYANAPAPVQRLFERSALVIVDFDKAIEDGFVRITDALGALASESEEG